MTDENTRAKPGTLIPLASLPNFRDIGGYRTDLGGRVRSSLLHRSVALDRLTLVDAVELHERGISTVFDLRTETERTTAPDRLPDGASSIVCDVLAGSSQAAPTQMLDVINDPGRAAQVFGGGNVDGVFHEAYRHMVSAPTALTAYRRLFTDIAEHPGRPILFHCTTGKDRTGWAAAAALLLLGVDEDDVFHDYELTNRDLLPTFEPIFERFAAAGADIDILRAVLGVHPGYLRAALEEMDQRFGSVRNDFKDGLGIDEKTQERMRTTLTE